MNTNPLQILYMRILFFIGTHPIVCALVTVAMCFIVFVVGVAIGLRMIR